MQYHGQIIIFNSLFYQLYIIFFKIKIRLYNNDFEKMGRPRKFKNINLLNKARENIEKHYEKMDPTIRNLKDLYSKGYFIIKGEKLSSNLNIFLIKIYLFIF